METVLHRHVDGLGWATVAPVVAGGLPGVMWSEKPLCKPVIMAHP
jgi:hypothetical protein